MISVFPSALTVLSWLETMKSVDKPEYKPLFSINFGSTIQTLPFPVIGRMYLITANSIVWPFKQHRFGVACTLGCLYRRYIKLMYNHARETKRYLNPPVERICIPLQVK